MKTMANIKSAIIGALLLISAFASAAAGGTITERVSVTAFIPVVTQCEIYTGRVDLDVGLLNPESATDVNKESALSFMCNGNIEFRNIAVTDDGGLHGLGLGTKRMRLIGAPDEYLPYSLAITAPAEIKRGEQQTMKLAVNIRGDSYRNVFAGVYEDIVFVTISP